MLTEHVRASRGKDWGGGGLWCAVRSAERASPSAFVCALIRCACALRAVWCKACACVGTPVARALSLFGAPNPWACPRATSLQCKPVCANGREGHGDHDGHAYVDECSCCKS